MKKIKKNVKHVPSNEMNIDLLYRGYWTAGSGEPFPVYPLVAGEVKRSNQYRFREEFSLNAMVVIQVAGKLIYRVGSKKFILNSGQALIIPRHQDYSFENISGKEYRKIVIGLKGMLLDQFMNTCFGGSTQQITLKNPEDIIELARQIIELLCKNNEIDAISGAGKAFELMYLLAQQKESREPLAILKRAQELLAPDHERLSVKQIAEKLGVSCSTIENLFKKHLNQTMHEYRIQIRLEQAKYLLSHSKLSIKEIAALLKYSSQFHFSHEFKKRFGSSPRKWRTSPK